MDLKRTNEDLDLNSLQMRLSNSSNEEYFNPFSDQKPEKHDSVFKRSITTRFSERFSVNVNHPEKDFKAKLKKYEIKLENLNEQIEEITQNLHDEQRTNEKLKELVLMLEEKLKKKEGIISNLQGDLKICEIEIQEAERLRDEGEIKLKKRGEEEVEKLKSNLLACQMKSRKIEVEKQEEIEKLLGQVKDLSKVNANLQLENQQFGKRIQKLVQDLEKMEIDNEKIKDQLIKQFEGEKREMEYEYLGKIDALKLSIKAYEDMQDMHSCSENTDNELSELEDSNRKINSEPYAYALVSLDKKVSYESMKIFDSVEACDESINSNKSILRKMSSTCQTENEVVSQEKYEELLDANEKLERDVRSFKKKMEKVRRRLVAVLETVNFLFGLAGKTVIAEEFRLSDGKRDLKAGMEFFVELKEKVEVCGKVCCEHQEAFEKKRLCLSLQSQEKITMVGGRKVKPVEKKKSFFLNWQKPNPIVSRLFGPIVA